MAEKGYTRPTPIQEQSIPAILAGRDIFGGAQTGTGKTASFTLPLLQMNAERAGDGPRRIRSLILVPTRELAAQVSDSVRRYGAHLPLKSATVAGGIPMRYQFKAIEGGVDILIATPGRLLDLLKRKSISLKQLRVLVLDEADRMLDMGFMPDIREILTHVSEERQTLMFSATTPKPIEALARTILNDPLRVQVGEENQVPDNVSHVVYFVSRRNKPEALIKLFKEGKWGQVLIFTRTKNDADELKDTLMERGLSAKVIHGGKPQTVRTTTLKNFKSGRVKILIATDVAARGLDIDLLPHVVNFELPQSPDDYVHRIGRTGRAGNKGTAVSLVSQTERHSLARIEKHIKKTFLREKLAGLEEAFVPHKGAGKWRRSKRKKFDPFKGAIERNPPPPKKETAGGPGKKKWFKKPWTKKKKKGPR